MGEGNVEVVKGVYEAFGRGDIPAVLGAMAPDVEWHEAEGLPYGGVYRSPEEVAQNVFGRVVEDIPDFGVAAEEFYPVGDTVTVVARYTGTGQATGKTLDLPAAHVIDVHDGKITRFRQFVDTVKFREATPVEASESA